MTDKISSGGPAPRSPDAGDTKETEEQRAQRAAREARAKSLSPTEEHPKVRKLAALAAMGRVAVPTDLNVLRQRLSTSTFGQVVRDLQQVKAEEDNYVALATSHPYLAKARPNYPAMYKIYQERLNQLYSPAAEAMEQPANPTPTIAEAIALMDLIEDESGSGVTELGRMAEKGDLQRVRALIQLGADVNATSEYGATPLIFAASSGEAEVVDELLANGANVHGATGSGTALHAVAVYGSSERRLVVVKRLLAAGLGANITNERGETALSKHLQSNNINPLIVKALLVNATQSAKDQALIHAAQFGHETVVKELLEQGAQVDARKADGRTSLMVAAAVGNTTIVQLLIDNQASLDLIDEYGDTALALAARDSRGKEAVRRLLTAGADVTIKNRRGLNALDQYQRSIGPANEELHQMLAEAMRAKPPEEGKK
jgi:ankyrin repeat protein